MLILQHLTMEAAMWSWLVFGASLVSMLYFLVRISRTVKLMRGSMLTTSALQAHLVNFRTDFIRELMSEIEKTYQKEPHDTRKSHRP